MSNNLAGLLTESAARFPGGRALRLDETVVTYKMLDDAASRVARLLKDRGLQPGERVGVMLPNVPYFGIVDYRVMRAGGVVVPAASGNRT